ncbi:MAG: hypothetical protein AB3N23_08275 [Paracoccaceae bacterium]
MTAPTDKLPFHAEGPGFAAKPLHDVGFDTVIQTLQDREPAAANGLDLAGEWDASIGRFPSEADIDAYYAVTVAGMVDGQMFEVGDTLLPLINNAATETYAGNWAFLRFEQGQPPARREFADVAALLADGSDYSARHAADVLRVVEGDFTYSVAPVAATDHHLITAGEVKLHVQPVSGDYVDRAFGVVADGVTDDAPTYQVIAKTLPVGATLRMTGAGERIIGSTVTFAQDDLSVTCDHGVVFKQAPNTVSMDTMIELSGNDVTWRGGEVNGNLSGNSGTYTGRGELLKLSGDHATCTGLTVDGTQLNTTAPVGIPCGLYLTGSFAFVTDFTSRNTGWCAIRDWGDGTVIDGARGVGIYNDNTDTNAARFIGKDMGPFPNGPDEAPFNQVIYRNIQVESASDQWMSGVVVDVDQRQGGEVVLEDVVLSFPNATGPDCFKFAYVDGVNATRVRTDHTGNDGDKACLRLQQGVKAVVLTEVDFAGFINFDGKVACDLKISANSLIGRKQRAPYAIQQFPGGTIVIADGCELRGFGTAAVLLDATDLGYQTRVELGALHLHGTDEKNAYVIQGAYPDNSLLRRQAGQILIRDPLSASGMRTRAANGSWIGPNLLGDAACKQGQSEAFLVNANASNTRYHYLTNEGPADPLDSSGDVDGWKEGDVIRSLNPIADHPMSRTCSVSGSSCRMPYAAGQSVGVGERRHNEGNVYVCTVAITSTTHAPTGTNTGLVDGSGAWDYVARKAVFQ